MRLFFLILLMLVAPFSAWANDCYKNDEYQAEQVIRFQTQLMVIAMMCDPYSDAELYGDYQKFSSTNQTVIKNNEKKLLSFFKNNNATSSDKSLHTLRTNIANEMAQYTSTQVPSKFCAKFQSRIDEAIELEPDDLKILVNDMGTEMVSSYPICSSH